MAWYPGAEKMELPESDAQPAIRPTQFIVHSIVAPWTARRTYEYWRDSTNLESHFGLGYEGDLGQYIGTETRADANAGANRRADGTGAVSIETASNTSASDPWTPEQIEQLIRLGVWLHQRHGIPLRICRTHDDPGFGYHRLFPQWSTSGTACPGDARVKQFREVVFPGIVARATGQTTPEEDDVALTAEEHGWLKALVDNYKIGPWLYKGAKAYGADGPETRDAYEIHRNTNAVVRDVQAKVNALGQISLTDAQLQALADKIAASPGLAEAIAELVADKFAARLAE